MFNLKKTPARDLVALGIIGLVLSMVFIGLSAVEQSDSILIGAVLLGVVALGQLLLGVVRLRTSPESHGDSDSD